MDDKKILCVWKNNLVLVPFDDSMSGMYARYDEAEIIIKDIDTDFWGYDVLIDDNEFHLLQDSWDVFQPSELDGIDALKEIIKLAKYIP